MTAHALPLRAAMVGLRIHAGTLDPDKGHGLIKSFKAMPDVEVVAYCEWAPDQATALAALGQHDPHARLYTALDDLLAQETFDIAVVMVSAADAPDTARRLLEAGKHLFIEKQAARTADELRPVVELAKAKGLVIQAGYPWTYHPISQEIRRLLDAGAIGRLGDIEVCHMTTQVKPGLRHPDHWMYRRATEGGGMLHMEGGHWISLMRFWAQSEAKSLVAMTARTGVGIRDDMEDVATVAWEFANGIHASLRMGYLLPAAGPSNTASIVLRGTAGHITWHPVGPAHFTLVSADPKWQTAPIRTYAMTLAEKPVYAGAWGFEFASAFVRAAREGGQPALSGEDALRFFEIVDAAYESSRTGQRIELRP